MDFYNRSFPSPPPPSLPSNSPRLLLIPFPSLFLLPRLLPLPLHRARVEEEGKGLLFAPTHPPTELVERGKAELVGLWRQMGLTEARDERGRQVVEALSVLRIQPCSILEWYSSLRFTPSVPLPNDFSRIFPFPLRPLVLRFFYYSLLPASSPPSLPTCATTTVLTEGTSSPFSISVVATKTSP